MKYTTHSILLIICLIGCVSQKKYRESEARADQTEQAFAQLQKKLDSLTLANYGLNVQVQEIADMYGEQAVETLESRLSQQKMAEQKRVTIQRLNKALRNRTANLTKVRNEVAEALYPYQHPDIKTYLQEGMVHIQLPDRLLFPTSSNRLGQKGRATLKELLPLLKSHPELEIIVEGHADSRPMRSLDYVDNWDLSAARANAVVRFFSDEGGIAAQRLAATARSDYDPVAPNDTERGRQLNRRIELLVKPTLTPLSELLVAPE